MTGSELLRALEQEGSVLPHVLAERAAAHPERLFLHYGEDGIDLTYGEAVRRIDDIAGNLTAAGVGRGDHVSVFLRNPLVSSLWMFAIWRAGAVFCPVNFNYSGQLLSYQLQDTAPKLLVTERVLVPALSGVADDIAEGGPTVVVHDAPAGAHDHVPPADRPELDPRFEQLPYASFTTASSPPPLALEWDDPSSIFYTSGTTGPSKGVVHLHRWMNQYTWGLRGVTDADDVIYNDLPLYHVGGAVFNVGRAAWCGASVALWDRFSSTGFWDRIRASGATQAVLLDVMIPWLMNAPSTDRDRAHSLDKVHMQPLPAHHHQIADRFGFSWVSAGFGQSEAGMPIYALIDELPDEVVPGRVNGLSQEQVRAVAARNGIPVLRGEDVQRKGLMGAPLLFAEAAVLDDRDQECQPDEVGHLVIRPKLPGLLVQEYLRKPEATVRAFRNLWFHTGDAAVKTAEGLYYFVDRLGDRIRVRGENVSSYEVEDIINRHADVDVCAVFPVPSDEGEEDRIVAYCVPRAGSGLDVRDVETWCSEKMPKFMRPSVVRLVDDLPRTPTNKIEKYRLKRHFAEGTAW